MRHPKVLPLLLTFIFIGGGLFAGLSKEKQPNAGKQAVTVVTHSSPTQEMLEDEVLSTYSPGSETEGLLVTEESPENFRGAPALPANLSKKEKRAFKKAVRKAVFKNMFSRKRGKRNKRSPQQADQILCLVVAFFIPPLGVYLWENDITTNFWISLIGMFLPPLGIIWAFLVILGVL